MVDSMKKKLKRRKTSWKGTERRIRWICSPNEVEEGRERRSLSSLWVEFDRGRWGGASVEESYGRKKKEDREGVRLGVERR